MNITAISLQSLLGKRISALVAIAALLLIRHATAQSIGSPVQVSPSGEIVAEFSSATARNNDQLMAASAIKEITPGKWLCGVYVSRDGGNVWSEVSAWPDSGLQAIFDPWVAIGVDGTIHAIGIGKTKEGNRVVYTQSQDQGVFWSAASAVTPFESKSHRRGADKDCIAVGADGTIYVAFTQTLNKLPDQNELIVARSTDHGVSWITRDTGAATIPNGIVGTLDGAVTVAIVGGTLAGYGTITSTDGGDTWGVPLALGELNLSGGLPLPSIAFDSFGRIVIGDIGGTTTPQLEISIEDTNGTLIEQRQLPLPDSDTCRNGRLIQPALTAGSDRSPAFQVGCKIDRTKSTAGYMEVWVYPSIDEPTPVPLLVTGFELPAGTSHDSFAKRFADGGDYWSFTWKSEGWLSMWVDPRSGGGPGELFAAAVTPAD